MQLCLQYCPSVFKYHIKFHRDQFFYAESTFLYLRVMLLMHTADCTYLPRRVSFIQQPNIDQIHYILGNTALTLLILHIGISYNAFESCIH